MQYFIWIGLTVQIGIFAWAMVISLKYANTVSHHSGYAMLFFQLWLSVLTVLFLVGFPPSNYKWAIYAGWLAGYGCVNPPFIFLMYSSILAAKRRLEQNLLTV